MGRAAPPLVRGDTEKPELGGPLPRAPCRWLWWSCRWLLRCLEACRGIGEGAPTVRDRGRPRVSAQRLAARGQEGTRWG